MRKKHRPRRVWLIVSILAFLQVTVVTQALAENGWLPTSLNGSLEEHNSSKVLLPSATTPADACSNCDAFDMKILSVTLTAISNNPDKTSTPSNNNLPASLIVFGIIFSIALVVLLVTRVILPKSGNRKGSEIPKNDVEQPHHEEKDEDHAG